MCTSPIWIKNRRYFNSEHALQNYQERSWDRHRLYLCVPCGRCEECLKRSRADWYVRLDRELAYQRFIGGSSIYITITIKPEKYESAKEDLASFVRSIFEHIRRQTGQSIKHALFPECSGSHARLHLHGFLFGTTLSYRELHRLFSNFGFVWLAQPTARRARYVVKYITKDITAAKGFATASPESAKRLRRKYISSGVGNYLGMFAKPDVFVRHWSYLDRKTNISYKYCIPRYYDKFKGVRELTIQDALSSYVSAHVQSDHAAIVLTEEHLREVAGSEFLRRHRSAIDRKINFAIKRNALCPLPERKLYTNFQFTVTPDILNLWLPHPTLAT